MQPEPKAKWRGRAGLILLVAVTAAIWWLLDRLEPRATWLRVEAPCRAVVGQPLPLRVRLAPLPEPARLCVDLHWTTTHNGALGCLASGGSKAVGKEGGTFDFEVPVRAANGLRFVTGIIYISPTGDWNDHTLAAATELLPVSSDPGATVPTQLEQLQLQPPADNSRGHPRTAPAPSWLTALLFLAAAVAAWGASPASGKRWWQSLALFLALACLWELSGLENWLDAHARAMATAGDFYFLRRVFQKAAISVICAATITFVIFLSHARGLHRLLLMALGLYLGIAAANLVSLHTIDQFASLSWHGVTLVQALKFGCAALILHGICRVRRAGCRPNPAQEPV